MRHCKDCGAKVDDVAMSCSECGSKNLSLIETEESNSKKKLSKGTVVKIIIVAVLAICIIGGIVFGAKIVIYRTQISPVVEGITALMKGDLDGYAAAFDEHLYDTVHDKAMASTGSDDFKTTRETDLKKTYGDDYKIHIKAVNNQSCSKQTVNVLNEMVKQYEITIDDAKYVTVTVFISGSNGEILQSKTLYSVKIDGKWSMLDNIFEDEE